VALFIHDPERLEIEIAAADGSPLSDIVHNPIQAKIRLEFLPLEATKDAPQGRVLSFGCPKRSMYQSSIQVTFLGMISTAN